ncbi:MAG: FAD-dependent monooxygenase [Mesorhizobium sp.]
MRSRQIVISGGGIAGLSAALAFSDKGLPVRLYERAAEPHEAGAGLQLSPNATRLLGRLGVLDALSEVATRPEAIVLRNAATLKEVARVPLGDPATARWQSPYLVLHRADLHGVLLDCARRSPTVEIVTGASVTAAGLQPQGVNVRIERRGMVEYAEAGLLVMADGVWSANRAVLGAASESRFSGRIAWRATANAEGEMARFMGSVVEPGSVTVFLHPRAHLIAYPIRGGASVNFAAFAKGVVSDTKWSTAADAGPLAAAFHGAAPQLADMLGTIGGWTVWPIHTVDPQSPWIDPRGAVSIGDAAHAMTPFAAQGAAMAIEDAYVLAQHVDAQPAALGIALQRYEKARRERVKRVAARGRLNEFVWHAAGPIALARNLFLKLRGPQRLAADLDWLYGWQPAEVS